MVDLLLDVRALQEVELPGVGLQFGEVLVLYLLRLLRAHIGGRLEHDQASGFIAQGEVLPRTVELDG